MTVALLILLGYVLGSMPWGLWLPKLLKGVDVRTMGSGNLGAANVGRALGFWYGIAVALLDIAKGLAAAAIARAVAGDAAAVLAGFAAMVGHFRPLFLGFGRGGKAAATALGVGLAVAPLASLATAILWIAIFLATRYSSLASLTGSVAFPVLVWALGASLPVLAFAVAAALAIVALHRSNLRRLANGTENRFAFSRRPWRWRRRQVEGAVSGRSR